MVWYDHPTLPHTRYHGALAGKGRPQKGNTRQQSGTLLYYEHI